MTFKGGDLLWANATKRVAQRLARGYGAGTDQTVHFPYREMFGKPVPTLYAYSSIISPKPAEWGDNYHLTGFLDSGIAAGFTADATLSEFLSSGEKRRLYRVRKHGWRRFDRNS
jgi:hypothetical protein